MKTIEKHFEDVKANMKGTKTLSLYDPAEAVVLEVDASTKGLRACLMQGGS